MERGTGGKKPVAGVELIQLWQNCIRKTYNHLRADNCFQVKVVPYITKSVLFTLTLKMFPNFSRNII